LGYHQSRWSYRSDQQIQEVIDGFKLNKLPLDAIHFDIHYMDQNRAFTFDTLKYGNPKSLIASIQKQGIHPVCIIDPGIQVNDQYSVHENGIKKDVFVKYPSGRLYEASVWPGLCHFPDFSNPVTRSWWGDEMKFYTSLGIDGFWNDMNEPATWGQDVPDLLEFDMDGKGGSHREAHNVYGQLMAQASRKGLESARPNERPFVLSRAGFAGIHRTAALWSGDNVANEEHFFMGIRIMLGMAMSGVSFSGPDVGGFVGDSGRDLFVRWVSVASFFPFFRIHSMIDSRDNEPWSYGELAEAIAGNYIRLRYKLLPVLYSAFYESSKTGKPVVRPWFWEKPCHDFNSAFQHQFFLGKDILVIPASPQQHAVQAELPPGGWYRLFSGEFHEGSRVHWLSAWLDRLPVLVRQGAILLSRAPAVVEAADDLFVDLPLTLLPPGTTEGDRVLLSARRPPLFSFSRFSVSQNPSAVSGAALGVSPPAVSLHPQKD
jgi:alpha-glucosidase